MSSNKDSNKPTKATGLYDQAVGYVEEKAGWLIGNKDMEEQGKQLIKQGEREFNTVTTRDDQPTSSTWKEAKGTAEEFAGKVAGKSDWEQEGRVLQSTGGAQRDLENVQKQAEGAYTEAKGAVKQGVGKLIGNDEMVREGKMDWLGGKWEWESAQAENVARGVYDQAKGTAKEAVGRNTDDSRWEQEGRSDYNSGKMRSGIDVNQQAKNSWEAVSEGWEKTKEMVSEEVDAVKQKTNEWLGGSWQYDQRDAEALGKQAYGKVTGDRAKELEGKAQETIRDVERKAKA